MGRKVKYFFKICPICNKEFKTYPNNEKKTCSRICMGKNQLGENNPNFGNKWTDEQKRNLSEYAKSKSEEISNRVKKDWENNEERKRKISETFSKKGKERIGSKNSFYGKKHSEETKQVISKKSKEKFTKEFNEKFRKTMEENGSWIKLEEVNDYKIYFKDSDWIERMIDKISDDEQLKKLKEFGIFDSNKNKNGLVRDHMFGRINGFKQGVFPKILRHICNCQLISSKQNVSKAQKNQNKENRLDSIIELEELFNNIKSYKGDWIEHDDVLNLISLYEKGERWKRQV